MAVISMKALLESGVHFGHRTHKWHPAMKPYIFTERNSIHIIDLQKTAKALEQAYALVRDTVAENGTVLFVGTKRQAQETVQSEAIRCGMPYVTNRWLGGMLTNWRTIRQRINELERLERMRDTGDFGRITKKEGLILSRVIERLETLLTGVREMVKLPDLLFVIDVSREATSIHEANLLKIPVIAMVDTNCDPRDVDYVIPSNDDAIRAIKLIVGKIADAAVEGKAMRKEEMPEEPGEEIKRAVVEEPELSDEELLGEATLAKLTVKGEKFLEEIEPEVLGLELEVEEPVEPEIEEEELVLSEEEWKEFVSGEEEAAGDVKVAGEEEAVGDAEVAGEEEAVGDAEVAGEEKAVGDAEVAGEEEAAGDAEVAGEEEEGNGGEQEVAP
jgi:small subunit ribosomal protein S2